MGLKRGYKQTEVGVIPEDWNVTLLDSIAKRGSGHTPDKGHAEYWGGKIKWVSLQDSDRLDRLYISDTAAKITTTGIANSSAKMHPAGTVVLSRDAGVGKSAIMKDAMAVSQHFIAWTCLPPLNNHFLYYWLQSNKSEFERIAMGSTIKTIGLLYFRQLVIPLPPYPEQEAIAEALSDTDALIESLEQLVTKKRQLKQGVMQELLTGKRRLPCFEIKHGYKQTEAGVIPEDWEVKLAREFASIKTGPFGTLLKASEYSESDGVPLISVGEIREGFLRISTQTPRVAGIVTRRLPQYVLRKGDIVFGRKGGVERSALIRQLQEGWFLGSDGISLRPSQDCDAEYLALQFQSKRVQGWLLQNAIGTTMPSLNQEILRNVAIPLPPTRAEQQAIAAILTDMDDEIAALEAKLAKARQLKQGMMQELLTGRIRLV